MKDCRDIAHEAALADVTIEQLDDAVFWVDAEGRVRRVNQAACDALGYARDELLSMRVHDFNPGVTDPWWKTHWAEMRAKGRTTFEGHHRRKDGGLHPVRIRATYLEFEGEAVVCSVVRDLSSRRLEAELLELETVAAVSPAVIFRADRFGRWLWVSDRWTELTSDVPQAALGEAWQARLHPEDRSRVVVGLTAAAEQGAPWRAEFRLQGPGGDVVWVFGQASLHSQPSEGGGGYVGALLDVTEQNRASRALREAKDAAESANRAKSEFLANMSHELRTPLNGILGYAQVLAREPDLACLHRAEVDKITEAGEHLLTLINDVLDLSRIEAGRLELEPVDFCLEDTLASLADMARVRAEQKGLAFTYEAGPNFPVGVHGDERKLRQILLNLLGNAVKFTDQGQVSLRVDEEAEGIVRFTVRDTGPGIAPEAVDRIFEPFTQLRGTRGEGTGLGLSIVRQLVRVVGGTLSVDSEVGKGSCFVLRVRLEPRADIEPRGGHARRRVGFHGRARRLLVVDDKPDNRMLLVRMLTPLGFEVCEAGDGASALQMLETVPHDAILMDLVMPGMDGLEATRRIRAAESTDQRIPIVALSAAVFAQNQQQSLEAGCDAFVPKPVRERELFEALDGLLDLEWIYEDSAPRSCLRVEAATPAVVLPPPDAVLDRLHDLAERGHIVGVRRVVEEIRGLGPEYAAFADLVGDEARRFEMQKIQDLVGAYRS